MITGGRRAGFILSGLVHLGVAGAFMLPDGDHRETLPRTRAIELSLEMFVPAASPSPPSVVADVEPVTEEPQVEPREAVLPVDAAIEPQEPKPLEVATPRPEPRRLAARRPQNQHPSAPAIRPRPIEQAATAQPEQMATQRPLSAPQVESTMVMTDGSGDVRRAYLADLVAAIHRNKFYPRQSRRRREQGTVVVAFIIEKDGTLSDVRVTNSSSIARLDRAALKTLSRLSPFRPIPVGLARDRWPIRVPIEFSLR